MAFKIEKHPVILVHGIWDTSAIFAPLAQALGQEGWSIYSLNLIPNDGSVRLEKLGEQLADFIQQTLPPHQKINLIGFSMGGLVSRYYIQRLGGLERTDHFITVSSPHKGTFTAYVRDLPGYLCMRPHSDFLRNLAKDIDTLNQINFTSLWTPFDAMIVPANSSLLGIGKEIQLNVFLHHLMIRNSQSIRTIIETLNS